MLCYPMKEACSLKNNSACRTRRIFCVSTHFPAFDVSYSAKELRADGKFLKFPVHFQASIHRETEMPLETQNWNLNWAEHLHGANPLFMEKGNAFMKSGLYNVYNGV